jgi:hypothetical protein
VRWILHGVLFVAPAAGVFGVLPRVGGLTRDAAGLRHARPAFLVAAVVAQAVSLAATPSSTRISPKFTFSRTSRGSSATGHSADRGGRAPANVGINSTIATDFWPAPAISRCGGIDVRSLSRLYDSRA